MQLRGRTVRLRPHRGGLLPADLLERVRALDRKLPGLDEAAYGLAKNERFGEAIARSWNRLVRRLGDLQRRAGQAAAGRPCDDDDARALRSCRCSTSSATAG